MASRRINNSKGKSTQRPPATTPEARENQLVSQAVDLASKQLREGTASAQVITHYLKLGSSREKLEQERMAMEVQLMNAKAEQIASAQRVEELYKAALDSMRMYSGQTPLEEVDEFEE